VSEVRPGDVIAGKFRIERVVGEGGMGYVVAARHLQLGQMVALKFMREEVLNDEYKSRFLREARNTVRLKSKHVSRVLDVGSLDGGAPYMVMEYLEGTDLSALLQKRGPFPVAEACDYIIQACEANAEAHGHGIVHRDLKPANLFLTRGSGGEPVVKVLDFGVSKVLELGLDDNTSPGGRHHMDSVVTKATDLLGSPSYMAPEQVISARDADSKSDVWSLGIILFRLISGKAPFIGASLGDLIQNIMHGPMPNLRDLRPDIPEGLEQVLWRILERDRVRRPDVVELARMLSSYAGPNATPSLERIAILGPALLTSIPAPSPSAPSHTGRRSNWTTPPGMAQPAPARDRDLKKDISVTGFLVWTVLLGSVALVISVAGIKFFKPRMNMGTPSVSTGAVQTNPTPVPQPSDPLPGAVTTTSTATTPIPGATDAHGGVLPGQRPPGPVNTGQVNMGPVNTGQISPGQISPGQVSAKPVQPPHPTPGGHTTTRPRPSTQPPKPGPTAPGPTPPPTPPAPTPTSEIPGTRD
jgi:eukaryotic-like serine/threonine-protein kinase